MSRVCKRSLVLALVLLLATVAPIPGAAQARDGTPSAPDRELATWSEARAVNDRRQIVGASGKGYGSRAVRWEGGEIAELGAPPAGN